MLYNSTLDALCIAPIIRISHLFPNHLVWCKGDVLHSNSTLTERADRVARYILQNIILPSIQENNRIMIIPIDGVTKISLAKLGVLYGIQVVAVAPKNISEKYIALLQQHGADIVYTPQHLGIDGAITHAKKIADLEETTWMPKYDVKTILMKVLAYEISCDFPEGIDYVVIPSKSTMRTNILAQCLKDIFPDIKIFMTHTVENLSFLNQPNKNALYYAQRPRNFNYVDGIILASQERAQKIASIIPVKEGLPSNISIAVACNAVEKMIQTHSVSNNKKILTFQSEI